MNIEWDSKTYGEKCAFVGEYGKGVVDLLSVPPGARVLDLGCGRGELTAYLAQRGWNAEGMDASKAQLADAKRRFPEISFFEGDITSFEVEKRYDAVFSNAVLHWIDKDRQPDALAHVRAALKTGGEFVFEMGGKGNAAAIHAALKEEILARGGTYRHDFFFPDEAEYSALLEAAGFEVRYASLFARPTPLKGEDGIADWIGVFAKNELFGLPEGQRRAAALAAQRRLKGALFADGIWTADYVRLRMKAVAV